MGRNAGSKIFLTIINDGTNEIYTWYCQQHAMWDQTTSISSWAVHVGTSNHGNVVQ